jgi:hypothetical protein
MNAKKPAAGDTSRRAFFRSLTSGRFLPETPPGCCYAETLRFPSASKRRHFASQVNERAGETPIFPTLSTFT